MAGTYASTNWSLGSYGNSNKPKLATCESGNNEEIGSDGEFVDKPIDLDDASREVETDDDHDWTADSTLG